MDTLTIKGKSYEVTDEQKAKVDELWNELLIRIEEMGEPDHDPHRLVLDNGYSPYKKITDEYMDKIAKVVVRR